MSKTIGPYRLNPRGDYNPVPDPLYSLLDLVSDGGGSFVYINDTPSNEPTSSTSHWQQIAEKGDMQTAAEMALNDEGGFFAGDNNVEAALQKVGLNNANITHNEVNAVALGAKGDNVTDNYTSLNNTFKAAVSGLVYDTTLSSNRIFTKTINLAPGVYRVKQSDLLANTLSARTSGLVINGNGATIVFEGFAGYCFVNDDKFLNVDFYNVNFKSLNDDTASSRTLFKSNSSGGAQGFRFHQCTFSGVFLYGIELVGSNNNSEWIFNSCSFSGRWLSFLYIAASGTSDQFLNYWFNNCKYWSSSNWITAYKGGHFKLNHCDVSGYQPSVDTYLFNLLGTSHSSGVTTFIDDGTRYELKSSQAKIIKCEWNDARISFENCDMSSNVSNSIERADYFYFSNATSGAWSCYTFKNCMILGKFKLVSGNSSTWNNLYFDECCLLGDSVATVITDLFTYVKGTNSAEFIKVNLSNTKYGNRIYSCTLNGINASSSRLKTNAIMTQSPYNTLLDTWRYPIIQDTIIDDVIVISRYRADGYMYNFAIKSDVDTVESIHGTKQIKTTNRKKIYIGNRITLGASNTIYTVTSTDVGGNFVTLDLDVEAGVIAGDTVSFVITNMNVQNNLSMKMAASGSKYIVSNDLYLKSYGATFPIGGIGASVIVKTIE